MSHSKVKRTESTVLSQTQKKRTNKLPRISNNERCALRGRGGGAHGGGMVSVAVRRLWGQFQAWGLPVSV